MALLAASVVGRLDVAGHLGAWSAAVFAHRVPVPLAVGVVGVALLAAATLAVAVALRRLVGEFARLHRLHRTTTPLRCDDVAVVDAALPEAVTLPGWRGSIVLTSGMLQALDAPERRVLLAHERSHLRHRHWVYRLALRLAAALLPTLRSTVRAADQALERWADEDAADAVGSRRLVAAAVSRAALATANAGRTALAPGFSHGAVVVRVEAMLVDRGKSRWLALVPPGLALVAATLAVVSACRHFEDLFELARHLFLMTGGRARS